MDMLNARNGSSSLICAHSSFKYNELGGSQECYTLSKTESVCGEGGKVFGDENLNNRNKTLAKPRMRENYARLRRIYKQRTGMCLDLYQAIWGAKSGGHGLAVKWRTTDPQNGLTLTGSCLIFPLLSSLCNERAFTLHSFDPTDYSKNSPDQYLCGECM